MNDRFSRGGSAYLWPAIGILATVVMTVQAAIAIRTVIADWRAEPVPGQASLSADAVLHETALADQLIRRQSQMLVDAVVQVESAGNPHRVGAAGERGLMQIKEETWHEVTTKLFDQAVPFDRAFEPKLNRRVGSAYLATLQRYLHTHRDAWRGDRRSLLLACYNAGPGRVSEAGFDLDGVSEQTRDYVTRVSALHDYYISQGSGGPEFATTLTDDAPASDAVGTDS